MVSNLDASLVVAATALERTRALHAAVSVRFQISFPLVGPTEYSARVESSSSGVTIGALYNLAGAIIAVPVFGFNLDDAISVHVASMEIEDIANLNPVIPIPVFLHPNKGPLPVRQFSLGVPIGNPPPPPGSPDAVVTFHAVIFDVRRIGQ